MQVAAAGLGLFDAGKVDTATPYDDLGRLISQEFQREALSCGEARIVMVAQNGIGRSTVRDGGEELARHFCGVPPMPPDGTEITSDQQQVVFKLAQKVQSVPDRAAPSCKMEVGNVRDPKSIERPGPFGCDDAPFSYDKGTVLSKFVWHLSSARPRIISVRKG